MNVLVVDDEIDQVETLRRGLRSKGHKVWQALSGQDALNFLQNGALGIDLVLTDYAMPIMNGLELLECLRERYGGIPVILMTAYGRKDLVIEALRYRCNGFIEKPFSLDDLLKEIERVDTCLLQEAANGEFSRKLPVLLHQINNPLMAISGGAQMVMLSLENPGTVKKQAENILVAVESILEINKGILAEAGGKRSPKGLIDIMAVLDESLKMFQELISLRGIRLERQWSDAPILVWGDRFDLEQLFKNLILNAIEAMSGKQGRENCLKVIISTDRETRVSIRIEDTGCGIPDEVKARMFTPYFTTKSSGTGLGLAVVKQIAAQHDGTVEADSLAGEGAAFTLTLPWFSKCFRHE